MSNYIHETAIVYPDVKLGQNIEIMENCVIGSQPYVIRRYRRVKPKFGIRIGDNVFINTGSQVVYGTERDTQIGDKVTIAQKCIIGHDSIIGEKAMINNSVSINGFVTIGRMCNIGTGATINERIQIGDNVIIGANSTVTKNIPNNMYAWNKPNSKGDIYCMPTKPNQRGLKTLIKDKIL
jgi:UDP-3-O-[3-hydroxymyristoyl] glucosamine N-acyltransferase